MSQSKNVILNGVKYPNEDIEKVENPIHLETEGDSPSVSKYYQKQWEKYNLNVNQNSNMNEAFYEKSEPEPKPKDNMYTRLKNRRKTKTFHYEGKEYIEIGDISFEDAMKIMKWNH